MQKTRKHSESLWHFECINLRNNEFLNENRNSDAATLPYSHFATIPLGTLLLAVFTTTDLSHNWSVTQDTK